MADLPTGTLTFLHTDIEGSTSLWEHHPDAMHAASIRHDALIERCVEQHHGTVVRPRGEGDSRFAVFRFATDAVAAAAAIQYSLYSEIWPPETPLRVRIALHTGEADLRAGDYYGTAVNRCARLRAIGYGGQTLISQVTYELVRDALPEGVHLLDRGEHRLKDLIRPERVFQLAASGTPDEFPALKSLDSYPTNLPIQLTSFIGREREEEEIRHRLQRPDVRLLTLTGPGGIGKTRLALQVAANELDRYADGVYFVALAPVNEPDLVLSAIARTLGVPEGGQPLLKSLQEHLQTKSLLLVLDNFEQVVDAAPHLAELLSAAPRLNLLVTSRAVLRISGENEYVVPSLSLPEPGRLPSIEQLSLYEAVRLFIERAEAVKADFEVNRENVPAIAGICHRLEGLPLAIELAAARIRVLSPDALLSRLESRLKALTGGMRDAPARQKTIRATIEWSYGLLEEGEKTLFRRLSVFSGGWTLEAAEAIFDGEEESDVEIDVLEGIESLAGKSLIRSVDAGEEGPRFTMLETLREYASERLQESGETEEMRRKQRDYFLRYANKGQPVEREMDNFRAASDFCREDETGGEAGLRINMALGGHLTDKERFDRMIAALDHPDAKEHTYLRAQEINALIGFCWHEADSDRDEILMRDSIAIAREIGDTKLLVQSLAICAGVLNGKEDFQGSRACLEESIALAREHGHWIAPSIYMMGRLLLKQGDAAGARAYAEESAALDRERGISSASHALVLCAHICRILGDEEAAEAWILEGMHAFRRTMNRSYMAEMMEEWGHLLVMRKEWKRATALFGAVEAVLEAFGFPPDEKMDCDGEAGVLRSELGEAAFIEAWSKGYETPLDELVDEFLEGTDGIAER